MSEGRTMAFVRYKRSLYIWYQDLMINIFDRLPGHDHASIGYALDAGASIVIPQIDTVEQAQHVVTAAKFGPTQKGNRSAPPCRWLPGIGDTGVDPTRSVWENVNDQAAIIIQIESEEGAHNLDAILTAVGDKIDAVWMGTMDMRVSMGYDGFWGPEPRFLEIVELYRNTLKKHNKPDTGMCLGGEWEKGANKAFVIVGGDAFAFLGDTATISNARDHLAPLASKVHMNGRG